MGKVKKEKAPKGVQDKKIESETSRKRKNVEKKKSSADEGTRKYGYISAHSVISMAESAGFSGIQEDVARNLAEDVTYRLRYIIQQCKKYMTHCKHKKLRSSDINEVLKMCDAPAIYGYSGDNSIHNFIYIKEADVFVLDDNVIDLPSFALSEILVQRKPSYYATGVWLKPEDNTKVKSELKVKHADSKSIDSDVQTNNENVKVSNKMLQSESQKSGSENDENETKIPTNLIKYYGVTCNTILGHSDLKIIFQDLARNTRIIPIVPYLLNFITIALNKLNSERQLKRLLQTVESLSRNKNIDFTPYSATTRVINAMLLIVASDKKPGKIHHDYHLRSYAGHVLSLVLSQWCSRDEQRQTIIKKMGKLLSDFKVSPKVHYGAMTLLTCLGPEALSASFWKISRQFIENLERMKLNCDLRTGNDVAMLEDALLAAAIVLYGNPTDSVLLAEADENLTSYFGDSLCNLKQSVLTHRPVEGSLFRGEAIKNGKIYSKPLKYMNSRYKPDAGKLSLETVFALPKPRKKRNTRIFFKFAGAIPVPEVNLKRRSFYSRYDHFVAGKESEGHVVVAGNRSRITKLRGNFSLHCLLSVF